MEGPPKDKGKGRALAPEEVQGEVTGVVCDLCDKKGVPCRWGKVSILFIIFCSFIDLPLQKTACVRACLGCQQARAKCQVGGPKTVPQKRTREEESPGEGPSRRTQVRHPWDVGSEGGADIGLLLKGVRSALEEQTWLMRQM